MPVTLQLTEAEEARFWNTVTKSSGCWICSAMPSGIYARIHFHGKTWMAHVVSYLLANGSLEEGKKVCHSCDTPKCVRPDHLHAKSQAANVEEMIAKKRNRPAFGTANHLAKLNEQKVMHIRQALFDGTATIEELALLYGLSFQGVYHVARGQVWKSVGGPIIAKRAIKLSVDNVIDIRRRAASGEPQFQIAESYNIWPGTVSQIVLGRKRKDVPLHP